MSEVLRREIRNLPINEVVQTIVEMRAGELLVEALINNGMAPFMLSGIYNRSIRTAPNDLSRFRQAVAGVSLKEGMILKATGRHEYSIVEPMGVNDEYPFGVATKDAVQGEPLPVTVLRGNPNSRRSIRALDLLSDPTLFDGIFPSTPSAIRSHMEQMMRWHIEQAQRFVPPVMLRVTGVGETPAPPPSAPAPGPAAPTAGPSPAPRSEPAEPPVPSGDPSSPE